MKSIRFFFLSEKFLFLMVKFSVYLNRHVFVMVAIPTKSLVIIQKTTKQNTLVDFMYIAG